MSLIQCPDCGKEISDQAPACPNCGRPILKIKKDTSEYPKKSALNQIIGCGGGCLAIIIAIFLLGLIVVAILVSNSSSNSSSKPEKYILVEWQFSKQGFQSLGSGLRLALAELARVKQGYGYQGVYVKITNHGYDRVPINPLYFKLMGGGIGYEPVSGVPTIRDISSNTELYDTGSIDGYLVFELPREVQRYQLKFEPVPFESYEVRYK